MNLLALFIILNIVNVVVQTAKSIITIKSGKVVASIVNAVAYGLYTVVLIYMTCDLPLFTKALVVALCNLVGVFIVKLIEEKMEKEKLWRVSLTILKEDFETFENVIIEKDIPYLVMETKSNKYKVMEAFCYNKEQSRMVRDTAKAHGAKFFVTENKGL